mmetsp:Transcript_29494/g.62664  ORF Transcript_29494/g.62664 Transcript_29494/m.62664 type:complete len:109 (-) Transcript_29494:413-739(-)
MDASTSWSVAEVKRGEEGYGCRMEEDNGGKSPVVLQSMKEKLVCRSRAKSEERRHMTMKRRTTRSAVRPYTSSRARVHVFLRKMGGYAPWDNAGEPSESMPFLARDCL